MDGLKNQHRLCLVKYVLFCSLSLLMVQGAPTLTDRERREPETGALKIAWVTSSPNNIIEGKPKDLECYFSGWRLELPLEVHWYKDGKLITNGTDGIYHSEDRKKKDGEETLRSKLSLPPGREEQEGFYNCSIYGWSSSASYEIQMIYECPLAKGPTNHSSEIVAGKSSNVSLSCWIDYDDYCPEELVWYFNDNNLELLPESDEKYSVELKDTHTKCQKEFILSIFDVTESDEGTYSCHWLCEYENTTKAAIDLKVVQTGALEIAWVSPTPNKIIEGKPKDLECYFSGWPLPHEVHWYKDGKLITNETGGIYHSEDRKKKDREETLRSTLHLPPGREEQEGFYKCSAINSIPDWSSSASYEIEMIYECPLAKGPTNHSSEIVAGKSSNVNLSCWIDYDGYCPEELVWYLNDSTKPLPESGKKYTVELKDTDTKCQKEFVLSIFDVTESDEGTYSCHWLCEYENTTKAAIDLKVVQTGVVGRL